MDERCLPVVKDFVKAAPYIKSVDDVRLLEVEVLKVPTDAATQAQRPTPFTRWMDVPLSVVCVGMLCV